MPLVSYACGLGRSPRQKSVCVQMALVRVECEHVDEGGDARSLVPKSGGGRRRLTAHQPSASSAVRTRDWLKRASCRAALPANGRAISSQNAEGEHERIERFPQLKAL